MTAENERPIAPITLADLIDWTARPESAAWPDGVTLDRLLRESSSQMVGLSGRLRITEAERDAARHIIESHTCGENVEMAYRRTLEAQAARRSAEARAAEAEAVIAEALSDAQVGEHWDFDVSVLWVREKLASRLTDAGYVVIRKPKAPSAVLARVKAEAWDEGWDIYARSHGHQSSEDGRAPALSGKWANPYRTGGEHE